MELPRRIVEGGAGEWAQDFVRSARVDPPSQRFRRGIAKELGVAVGAVGITSTTTTAAKALGSLLWLKWLAIGSALGVASTLTLSYAFKPAVRPSTPRVSATGVAAAEPVARPRPQSAIAAAVEPPPAVSAEAWPANAHRPDARLAASANVNGRPGAAAVAAPAPAASSTLGAEMAAIDLVHGALAANDAHRALQGLDRYQQSFPSGVFSLEAQVLRIEALSALGQREEARGLAQRFLVEQADSPYVRRVRSLLGSDTDSKAGSNPPSPAR
ncbi:MAG TPA: hypothetical protein VGI10_08875 [Polyangiaceae bacterium]|jgi:hypothetical protein